MNYSTPYGSDYYDCDYKPHPTQQWATFSDPMAPSPTSLCLPLPIDQGFDAYLQGEPDSCCSDLSHLSFFDTASEFSSQTSYYPSPVGSAFTESPPSTGRSGQSYLSPGTPLSPFPDDVYDQTAVANNMTPQFIEDSPASYGQPLIFQSFQTQNSPSQWMHPLPDTTSELHDSLGCLSLSQDDNHLGLRGIDDVQPHQQDFSVPEIPSQQLSLCQRGLTKKKKNSSQGRKAKKPYTSEHPIQAGSAPNVPLPDRIPHPTHSLKQKHSLEEGMYLFRKGSNKRKAVAGFCWLPLEDFSSLDEFLDNFVYHPRRNAGVHKELPKCYCTTGNLISLDGNKQRGFDTRIKRDPNNCYYCLFCDADFTAKHNVYYHVAGHFNLKRMAAPCGELLGGDSDAKRHLKGCASCLESGLAHYPVPFEELRYTIIEGARRDPIHGWQFNTDN